MFLHYQVLHEYRRFFVKNERNSTSTLSATLTSTLKQTKEWICRRQIFEVEVEVILAGRLREG